jgi:hypothetical protein
MVLGVIGSIIEELSTPIDPATTAAIVNAMQGVNSGTNTNAGSTPAAVSAPQPGPVTPAAVGPSGAPDRTVTESFQGRQAAPFDPPGVWRVSAGPGSPVSLVVDLDPDGTFEVTTETEGFSFPASAGGWMYDPSRSVLTLTGFNNAGAFFQTIFQNVQAEGDHYRAFVPGEGNVILRRE